MKTKNFRKRHEFWLNLNSAGEAEVAEIVKDLKSRRGYASAIRDGLRMVWELRQGKVDTLVKLFPWVVDAFAQPKTAPDMPDMTELKGLMKELKSVMRTTQTMEIPAWNAPMASDMNLKTDYKLEARVVVNKEESIKRSVQNTLAALQDF